MKRYITILVFALIWITILPAFAITQEGFTLTVLKDNNPVREFDGQVAIPFDTEYKLRIKNNNHRRCSATVWIDGAKVSEIGNFIIDGNDKLDLERFLNESLTEGKRFKFVPLDHPDVDDPSRVENGIVKVEFRLERQYINLEPKYPFINPPYYPLDGDITFPYGGVFTTTGSNNLAYDIWEMDRWASTQILTSTTNCSSAGATVPGSHSNQAFYKIDFSAEDEVVIIRLRLVGI